MAKAASRGSSASSTLLIVDDDASQLRALTRAVQSSRKDISVLTAAGASEAIELLVKAPVSIVLSDLQMPEMDGFELVAWMIRNVPQITVFAMTAYWSQHTEEKLTRLGGIECFTKPIDVAAMVERIDEVVAGGFRGHIQNMSAASLLQIINMDRKTCTLLMATPESSGQIYMHKGEIIDARSGELRGERAALAILGWPYPTITIDSRCRATERTIDKPVTFLIMEAMRLADERARADDSARASSRPATPQRAPSGHPSSERPRSVRLSSPSSSRRTAVGQQSRPSMKPTPAEVASARLSPRPDAAMSRIAQVPLSTMKALGLALVHTEGRILSVAAEARMELTAMAKLAGSLLIELRATQARLAGGQAVEELVFTASGLCSLIKPLVSFPDAFVLLVFNPLDTSLAIRRAELDELVRTLETLVPASVQ
jgi:CheY-like chemotaxis protein